MDNKKRKTEPWRIVVFILAIAFIVFMWVKKDVAVIYAEMPEEDIAPIIVTTIAVSLLKVAAIAGVVLLVKWIIAKSKRKLKTVHTRKEHSRARN